MDTADLTRPVLRRFPGLDGREISGWLYRPDSPAPWPTMIHLHGGPEAQERPVYNSLFQSLVAAGVAVFAPNVRGSSGFGRSYETADDVELRLGSVQDVYAAAEHLIGCGISTPGRVGLMGRSYGGYLTLAGLTWYPEMFAVGIDVCGMADLETFYQHTEPWIAAAAVSKYGDRRSTPTCCAASPRSTASTDCAPPCWWCTAPTTPTCRWRKPSRWWPPWPNASDRTATCSSPARGTNCSTPRTA